MSKKSFITTKDSKPSETETSKESSFQSPDSLSSEVTETPVSDSDTGVSLLTVVNESKAQLADAAQVPVKNKGGRPKGSKTVNRSEVPKAAETPLPVAEEGPSELAPLIAEVAGLPFAIAAGKTGNAGLVLDPDEASAIGNAADRVVSKYFPDLNNKAGVELVLGFTVITVILAKYRQHQMWLESKKLEAKRSQQNNTVQRVDPKPVQPSPLLEPKPTENPAMVVLDPLDPNTHKIPSDGFFTGNA